MREHGTKTTVVFPPADGEGYFQVGSPYYQAAQCNENTPIPYPQGKGQV